MKSKVIKLTVLVVFIVLTGCQTGAGSPSSAQPKPADTVADEITQSVNTAWDGNTATIWNKLQHTSVTKLKSLQSDTTDPEQQAWLALALISKQKQNTTADLVTQLEAWRAAHPDHPGNSVFPSNDTLNGLTTQPLPQHVAVLIPQSGSYATSGQSIREGFVNAYYNNPNATSKQSLKFYNTTNADVNALYQQAVADGADFVVGPLIKDDVQALAANAIPVTTIALNYTNGSLPTNYYEFGLAPEDETVQLADRAYEAGKSKALIIAPQTPWGDRLVATFKARWETLGGSVQDTWLFTKRGTFNDEVARLLKIDLSVDRELMREDNDKNVLSKQRRQDFDVIFIFAQAQDARTIVPLLNYYYVTDVPIYGSSSVYSGRANAAKDADLKGVTVCDIPVNEQSNRLYAVGQDAFQLSQSLVRMNALPNFPVYGSTGAMILDKQQIHRRMPCRLIG